MADLTTSFKNMIMSIEDRPFSTVHPRGPSKWGVTYNTIGTTDFMPTTADQAREILRVKVWEKHGLVHIRNQRLADLIFYLFCANDEDDVREIIRLASMRLYGPVEYPVYRNSEVADVCNEVFSTMLFLRALCGEACIHYSIQAAKFSSMDIATDIAGVMAYRP